MEGVKKRILWRVKALRAAIKTNWLEGKVMWIKTKSGRCYNLDRTDGLMLKRNRDREVILYAMIHEKGFAIEHYQSVKQAQKVMDEIMDGIAKGYEVYEMD